MTDVEIDWKHPGIHTGHLVTWVGCKLLGYAPSSDIQVRRFEKCQAPRWYLTTRSTLICDY